MIGGLLKLNPWMIGGLLVAFIALGVVVDQRGYARGHAAAQARSAQAQRVMELALAKRGHDLRAAMADLQTAEAGRSALIERFENEAFNDLGADRPALSGDSVQRLRARWAD